MIKLKVNCACCNSKLVLEIETVEASLFYDKKTYEYKGYSGESFVDVNCPYCNAVLDADVFLTLELIRLND